MAIDLGAIAKGYAADEVSRGLISLGLPNHLVAIGGELRAHGICRGEPWQVGIETPTPDLRRVMLRTALHDASLSTSGDYRNFFESGGVRYCHEIDPATGRPVTHRLASVSVRHPRGMTADALATALMVLAPDEGYALATRDGIAAIFIIRVGERFEVRATPGFESSLEKSPADPR